MKDAGGVNSRQVGLLSMMNSDCGGMTEVFGDRVNFLHSVTLNTLFLHCIPLSADPTFVRKVTKHKISHRLCFFSTQR